MWPKLRPNMDYTGWPLKHGREFLVLCTKLLVQCTSLFTCTIKSHFLQDLKKTRPCLPGHPMLLVFLVKDSKTITLRIVSRLAKTRLWLAFSRIEYQNPAWYILHTGWPVKPGRVYLVHCKKWLCPVCTCTKASLDKSLHKSYQKNTAMFIWSGCIGQKEKHKAIFSSPYSFKIHQFWKY